MLQVNRWPVFLLVLADDRRPTTDDSIELERYELTERPHHIFELERRDFFKLFGFGLAVFAVVPAEALQQGGESGRAQRGDNMPQ